MWDGDNAPVKSRDSNTSCYKSAVTRVCKSPERGKLYSAVSKVNIRSYTGLNTFKMSIAFTPERAKAA